MFSKTPPSFYLNCYSSPEHDKLKLIRHLEFAWSGNADTRLITADHSGTQYTNAAATISEDGLFTITVPVSSGKVTLQYIYFFASQDYFVLTDGDGVYCFNGSWFDEYRKSLADNLTPEEAEKLGDMSAGDIEAVIERKQRLIADIAKAFSDVGINVDINASTGELAMDSSVLFGGDSADITDSGKALLNKVVKAYTSVIFNDEYSDFVSGITVAGHTAPIDGSSYEADLPLSEQRAGNVKNYCVSAETGLDEESLKALADTMTAVGMSNSRPVYTSNGSIDYAASRRVTFHITLSVAALSGSEAPSEKAEV